ncbi:MAG TPA: hypothetical protein DCG34_03720 [Clostridiales bacterium]|nr:hypothetical protein [Clostridiales bacterium]
MIRTRVLVLGAMNIVLTIVFFTVFRGMLNFLNAFLIPMSMFVFLRDMGYKEMTTVFIATFFMVFVTHQLQIVFFISYGLTALLLIDLNRKVSNAFLSMLIISFFLSLNFFIATVITDFTFMTRIRVVTIAMMGGRTVTYIIYLLIFGLLTSIAIMAAISTIDKIRKNWRGLK